MRLFTIGFTKKTAQEFFELLQKNSIKKVIDIRLNNASQLAGFSKGNDLKYFLREICNIEYDHESNLAPTKEILDDYKGKRINWLKYEELFQSLLTRRNAIKALNEKTNKNFEGICLLCSEDTAKQCHRRLVAEYIKENNPDLNIEIIHL